VLSTTNATKIAEVDFKQRNGPRGKPVDVPEAVFIFSMA
jgi:hypothetical protein